MKKIYVSIFIMIISVLFLSSCQFLKKKSVELPGSENERILPDVGSYDLFILYEEAGEQWFLDSDNSQLAWAQALNVWEAYITIYEATKDEIWLDKLVLQIDEALKRRDNCIGKKDINGNSLPGWSYTADPELYNEYYFTEHTGLILHPILRFVEEVKSNSIERYYDKAEDYLQACIDALSIFDKDILALNSSGLVTDAACYDLWKEEHIADKIHGFYVGHLYYAEPYFKSQGYVTNNMMPYNKSLALSQCYPVLYRLTREQIWLDKTQKAWNWFNDGIQKDDEAWWWYYSKYWDWNRLNPTLSQNVTDKPEEELGYYEDYEGHYSVDLMFLIEAHKIGVLNDGDLYEISKNKKVYGLKKDGWTYIMKSESREKDNLKAAVYFDYFVTVLGENDYCDIVFPVLKKEIEEQNMQNILADESTGNNGTCLRLLASAVLANMNETSMEK